MLASNHDGGLESKGCRRQQHRVKRLLHSVPTYSNNRGEELGVDNGLDRGRVDIFVIDRERDGIVYNNIPSSATARTAPWRTSPQSSLTLQKRWRADDEDKGYT